MNESFKRVTKKNEKEITIPQKSYYDPMKKQKLVIFGSDQNTKSYRIELKTRMSQTEI